MDGKDLIMNARKHKDFVYGIIEKLTELYSILETVEQKGKTFSILRKITELNIFLQDSEVEDYIYMNSDFDELWRFLEDKMSKLNITK
ncbi:hypothetical protein GCM10007103_25900 [Salinimicrobium marinum]|uniref:Uncharacterized protein n=1 Tax=Salinimicrobium marinum TaxID=680283 RepID=A0A918SHN9_9FLAO|nr:hypothetical protein [Salinimicrobium marinum]GHA43562.1 hypothetical protein GCM10007103_25900 [Salinimicrobium marinum]